MHTAHPTPRPCSPPTHLLSSSLAFLSTTLSTPSTSPRIMHSSASLSLASLCSLLSSCSSGSQLLHRFPPLFYHALPRSVPSFLASFLLPLLLLLILLLRPGPVRSRDELRQRTEERVYSWDRRGKMFSNGEKRGQLADGQGTRDSSAPAEWEAFRGGFVLFARCEQWRIVWPAETMGLLVSSRVTRAFHLRAHSHSIRHVIQTSYYLWTNVVTSFVNNSGKVRASICSLLSRIMSRNSTREMISFVSFSIVFNVQRGNNRARGTRSPPKNRYHCYVLE